MSNKYISEEEIAEWRTPFELMNWAKQKRAYVASTLEGEHDLILKKKLAKKFEEEVYPQAKFGYRKFGNNEQILIKPIIGNQNYDAIVKDLSSEPVSISYIEITTTLEGKSDHEMRVVLANQGIWQSGPFVVSNVKDKELSKIVEAAERKKDKDYPKDTSLVIYFNDGDPFQKCVGDNELVTLVKEKILNLNLRFSKLYLFGEYNDTFLEFNLD